jgi:pheromone shutdown protein TraB
MQRTSTKQESNRCLELGLLGHLTMMISLILSLIAGMVLGQRFKVLILPPAIVLAIIAATAAGIARGDRGWSIVLLAVAVTVLLQIGYLIGTGIVSFIVAGRASRPRHYSTPLPAPAVVRRSVR